MSTPPPSYPSWSQPQQPPPFYPQSGANPYPVQPQSQMGPYGNAALPPPFLGPGGSPYAPSMPNLNPTQQRIGPGGNYGNNVMLPHTASLSSLTQQPQSTVPPPAAGGNLLKRLEEIQKKNKGSLVEAACSETESQQLLSIIEDCKPSSSSAALNAGSASIVIQKIWNEINVKICNPKRKHRLVIFNNDSACAVLRKLVERNDNFVSSLSNILTEDAAVDMATCSAGSRKVFSRMIENSLTAASHMTMMKILIKRFMDIVTTQQGAVCVKIILKVCTSGMNEAAASKKQEEDVKKKIWDALAANFVSLSKDVYANYLIQMWIKNSHDEVEEENEMKKGERADGEISKIRRMENERGKKKKDGVESHGALFIDSLVMRAIHLEAANEDKEEKEKADLDVPAESLEAEGTAEQQAKKLKKKKKETSSIKEKEKILLLSLCCDQFGSNVMQKVIEACRQEEKDEHNQKREETMKRGQQFSSLEGEEQNCTAVSQVLQVFREAICFHPDPSALCLLLTDSFGNYVLQTILEQFIGTKDCRKLCKRLGDILYHPDWAQWPQRYQFERKLQRISVKDSKGVGGLREEEKREAEELYAEVMQKLQSIAPDEQEEDNEGERQTTATPALGNPLQYPLGISLQPFVLPPKAKNISEHRWVVLDHNFRVAFPFISSGSEKNKKKDKKKETGAEKNRKEEVDVERSNASMGTDAYLHSLYEKQLHQGFDVFLTHYREIQQQVMATQQPNDVVGNNNATGILPPPSVLPAPAPPPSILSSDSHGIPFQHLSPAEAKRNIVFMKKMKQEEDVAKMNLSNQESSVVPFSTPVVSSTSKTAVAAEKRRKRKRSDSSFEESEDSSPSASGDDSSGSDDESPSKRRWRKEKKKKDRHHHHHHHHHRSSLHENREGGRENRHVVESRHQHFLQVFDLATEEIGEGGEEGNKEERLYSPPDEFSTAVPAVVRRSATSLGQWTTNASTTRSTMAEEGESKQNKDDGGKMNQKKKEKVREKSELEEKISSLPSQSKEELLAIVEKSVFPIRYSQELRNSLGEQKLSFQQKRNDKNFRNNNKQNNNNNNNNTFSTANPQLPSIPVLLVALKGIMSTLQEQEIVYPLRKDVERCLMEFTDQTTSTPTTDSSSLFAPLYEQALHPITGFMKVVQQFSPRAEDPTANVPCFVLKGAVAETDYGQVNMIMKTKSTPRELQEHVLFVMHALRCEGVEWLPSKQLRFLLRKRHMFFESNQDLKPVWNALLRSGCLEEFRVGNEGWVRLLDGTSTI